MTRKYGRNTDGKFAPGNPGKPVGARHRATRAVLELLDGEAEALTRRSGTEPLIQVMAECEEESLPEEIVDKTVVASAV